MILMQHYKLKVKLLNVSKPPVWREVLVPRDCTFDDLHHVIQIAMGWEFAHLYQFILGDRRNPIYVNNFEWLGKLNYINFLREVGKHFTNSKGKHF